MNDKQACNTIMDVLVNMGVPEYMQGMILGERNIALRQSLRVLPKYEDAVIMMNDALAAL